MGVLAVVLPLGVAAVEIGPEADLCAAIQRLEVGDELVLRPGTYQGRCVIRRGGTPAAPLVIRARDDGARPRIVYAGRSANVLEIRASHVALRGLGFGTTEPEVDAVRVFGAADVTIEDCEFFGIGGIAVVANHGDVRGLVVRRNVVRASRATAMYFGCHDGLGCRVSELLVEGNTIHDVTARAPAIGYGIQVKLNSTGVIRGNVVTNTKGPGVMVYGSRDAANVTVVERNFVSGARTSSGIRVGGGPAVVRNNITVANGEAGIALQDYDGRGLLRDIVVAHNTLYGNATAGIAVPPGVRDVAVVNNAVAGTAPLPPGQPGLRLLGNVECMPTACFVDPDAGDFSPLPGILIGAAADAWTPADDFSGTTRGARPTIGAIEPAPAPTRPTGARP